jgi:hypothetical protein
MKGFLDVNSKWLEALDSSSGEQRVYYIDRSTQETAWVPPEPYMALVAEIERSEVCITPKSRLMRVGPWSEAWTYFPSAAAAGV